MSEQLTEPNYEAYQSPIDKLTAEVAYRTLHYLTKDLNPGDLQNQLFGVDHKNRYSFSHDAMVGDPTTGFCLQLNQIYAKTEEGVSNVLTIRLPYGHHNPKHPEPKELLGLGVEIDISDDQFKLLAVTEDLVGSHYQTINTRHDDPAIIKAILEKMSSTLDHAESLPSYVVDSVQGRLAEGRRYDYRKFGRPTDRVKRGSKFGRISKFFVDTNKQ